MDFSVRSGTLEIAAGTTVTWTNNDTVPHTATADDGAFDSVTLSKGESSGFTFDVPGSYPYLCPFPAAMRGTIVVTEQRAGQVSQHLSPPPPASPDAGD